MGARGRIEEDEVLGGGGGGGAPGEWQGGAGGEC